METTTINISEDVRKQLLRVARTGEKVGYDEAVRYLLSRVARDARLFRQAGAPVDVDLSRMRKELRKGRTENRRRENELEAKYA